MENLRVIEEQVIADNRVSSDELRRLREVLYADRKIDRNEADFLVVLHKRLRHRSRAFDQFVYNAIKRHLLADGRIDREETAWLRDMVFFNETLEDEERKFLGELKGEAQELSPEFETFLAEALKLPPEQRTSGG